MFVTFGVIILTLVGQGAVLPYVARVLGLRSMGEEERMADIMAELAGRQAALADVEQRLETLAQNGELPDDVVELLRTRHQSRAQILPSDMEDALEHMRLSAKVKRELIDSERQFIHKLLRDGKITDEARRRIEYELDLEEASLANRGRDGGGWM
jgi:CPA1 family monovalent cation:H+ antiporter